MNTIQLARHNCALTQAQLGYAANISAQAVLRYEQLLYEHISEKIVNALVDNYGLDGNELRSGYQQDRVEQRNLASTLVQPLPPITVSESEHPFVTWREKVGKTAVGNDSRVSFCILLAVHPGSVAAYEKGAIRSMPRSIKSALEQVIRDDEYVQKLEQFGEYWYDRRTA